MINPENPSRTVGTTSLVLGLLSVVPFGALAGVPAVVLAVYALREEPRSRGRATAGAAFGGVGIAMTVALVLLVSFMAKAGKPSSPAIAGTDGTRYSMYTIQGSLEEWATEHGEAFPSEAEFDSDSSPFVLFLARDRVG
jgi:hypothetical protein